MINIVIVYIVIGLDDKAENERQSQNVFNNGGIGFLHCWFWLPPWFKIKNTNYIFI